MKTLHICFHAHLDPVWLWPWQAGLDEALATCRSACDRLDAHPDLYFTQGEAWVYRQVQLLDPALFERIRKHIASGHWEIGGGWWTQPDCNAPDYNGLEHQIEIGKRYFLKNFGQFPDYAFNPDSFGHNATLPELLTNAGQHHYIMMRPMEHEMSLPYRFFNWQGVEGGPQVTVFRIPISYLMERTPITEKLFRDRVEACFQGMPDGIDESICFAGLGDHGGGPTEELIAKIQELADIVPGVHAVFSTPSRFYAAVKDKIASLPLYTGELQFHSIGCYSVHREGKLALLKATQRMTQAELAFAKDPGGATAEESEQLEEHWRNVVFHQFHDTLGGSCIASAYRHVRNQLGAGEAWAEEKLQYLLRKKIALLPPDIRQRMIFFNASDEPFEGWVHAEPWMEGKDVERYRLLDESGNEIPYQCTPRECLIFNGALKAYELYLKLAPNELKSIRLEPLPGSALASPQQGKGFSGDGRDLANASGAHLSLIQNRMQLSGQDLALPEVVLLPDGSDTWTHVQDRYAEAPALYPTWEAPVANISGEHLWEIARKGRVGDTQLVQFFRITDNRPDIEMTLRVDWNEHNKLLKLLVPLPENHAETRTDAIPGHGFVRPQNGQERPIQGWTYLDLPDGRQFGVLCPEVFALDGTPQRLRLTLLRSPQMAHHTPCPGGRIDVPYSDRGEHTFRFRFQIGKLDEENLRKQLLAQLRPLIYADLTRGMRGVRSGDQD